MSGDLAVVFDVAGTLLQMYRVANDIDRGTLLEGVVTAELIMEKAGRALVVPQLNPEEILELQEELPIGAILDLCADTIEISCSSSTVTIEEAANVMERSHARISDIQDTYRAVRKKCPRSYQTTGIIVDVEKGDIPYIVSTGGVPYPGLRSVIRQLQEMGADIYVASGDSMRSLVGLQEYGIPEEQIQPVSDPWRKMMLVLKLKSDHKMVVMVGDGLNDLYAIQAADLGVLTVQQPTNPPSRLLSAANCIIKDLRELPGLLMERTADLRS